MCQAGWIHSCIGNQSIADGEFTEAACNATERLRAAASGDLATLLRTQDAGKITADEMVHMKFFSRRTCFPIMYPSGNLQPCYVPCSHLVSMT